MVKTDKAGGLFKVITLIFPLLYYVFYINTITMIDPYFANTIIYVIPILYFLAVLLFCIKAGIRNRIFELVITFIIYLPILMFFYFGLNSIRF